MIQQDNNPALGGQTGQSGQQQIQIKATDEKMKGEYSNLAKILHTKEEFVIDFLNVFPPTGTLTGRMIMSPGHFKRMAKAMEENLKKFEEKFGKIEEAVGPEGGKIGFE